jgi:hypothetical protein
MILRRNKQLIRRLYLKEIPLILNYRSIKHARIIGQFFGLVLFTGIIAFTVYSNFTPLGLTVNYDLAANTNTISPLGPKYRVGPSTYYGQAVSKITDDLVYFTTNFPFNFDTATVKVYFQNPSNEQTFSIGFQDQSTWHYNTLPFDAPFLNNLKWKKNGNDTVLYQKKQNYLSADNFFSNPPHNAIIGTFNYDSDIGNSKVTIPNYKPQTKETVINTPLRGRQVLYAYLQNEPFHMTIEKQDLNWYADPDTVTITVYKDNILVYQAIAGDDGIKDGSHRVMPPTDITISNPGPGLPENGVYKIVIDANGDTIIKSIKTNLHKIVFANSIFPVANSDAYSGIASSTSPTSVYTNALSLSATAIHTTSEQIITVGKQQVNLNELNIPITIIPTDLLTKVVIPKSDVVLNGFQGYFAFTPDEYFTPSNYFVLPVNTSDDLNLVDYLVTTYHPSYRENGWLVNEQTFDLSTAYSINNKLSWLIDSPQLKQNSGSLIIKDIQITFHKNGWFGH